MEQAGFDLLVDIPNGLPGQRIVQVTPPGSACSIGFGTGVTPAKPEVQHIADGAWMPGPDPGRANYMSFAEFSDPDGNLWLLQERRGQPATPDR